MEWVETVSTNNNTWFLIFTFLLLLLGVMKQSEGERLEVFLRAFLNPNLLSQQVRQERAYNRVTIPIFFVIIATMSLFIIRLAAVFTPDIDLPFGRFFLLIVSSLMLLTALRSFIYFGFGQLLKLGSVFRLHNLQWLLHNFVLALVLLPLSIFITFGPESWTGVMVYTGLACIVLMYIIRIFRLFRMTQSELRAPWVYNLLYLCALEILPPILAVVGVLRQAEG